MKIKTIVLMAFLCSFAININAQDVITKTHKVEDIQSIAASGNVDVYITQGNTTELKIEATEAQHKAMELEISDDGFSISHNGKSKEKAIKVYVKVSNFKNLAASAGADIVFENEIKTKNLAIALSSGSDLVGSFDVEELSCAASSGSDLNFKNSQATEMKIVISSGSDFVATNMNIGTCNLVISSGSDANLSGSCDEMSLVTSGGSDVTANNFEIKKCNLVASGSSDVNIHVTGELSVNVSGASDVNCKGNPKIIKKEISKSAEFNL